MDFEPLVKILLNGTLTREQRCQKLSEFLARQSLWYGHGTGDAISEAHWMLDGLARQAGGWSQISSRRLTKLLERRVVDRIPLAYLLNEAWFAGINFYVDKRVLIPRSPLAEVIERGFAPWHAGHGRLLDLGTGSGCIALAAAVHGGFETVDAVDVDTDALAVADINRVRLKLADRVALFESDWFSAVTGQYDVIVANPPYVPLASMAQLPPEYRHEPHAALVAGELGLDCAETILRGAGAYLTEAGVLFLELGEAAPALAARYPQVPFVWLEFERGGEGVLALDAGQVREYWP